MRHEFHWDKYDGLQDFYGDKQKFSWDMTSWLWEKPVNLTKLEWQLFMSWAEKVWDQEEDWENYMKKWPENAEEVFKKWIDEDYEEFLSHHKPLHKDVFIRFVKRLETSVSCCFLFVLVLCFLLSFFSSFFLFFLVRKSSRNL